MTHKYETKKITEIEKFSIKGMISDGFTDQEIKEALNRSPKSKIVNSLIKEFRAEVPTSTDEDVQEISQQDIENWRPAVVRAVKKLEALNIETGLAYSWIQETLKEIDLNQEPDEELILSYVNSNFGAESLIRDASGAVVSTGMASSSDDNSVKTKNEQRYSMSTFKAKRRQ